MPLRQQEVQGVLVVMRYIAAAAQGHTGHPVYEMVIDCEQACIIDTLLLPRPHRSPICFHIRSSLHGSWFC